MSKVTFQVEELQKRLGQLGAVVSKKSAEKVYGQVRLFVEDGTVKLTGIDIDSTLTVKLPAARAEGNIDVLLEYIRLNEIVTNLRAKELSIEATGNTATLKAIKFKAQLECTPVDSFTSLPVVQGIAERPEIGGYEIGLVNFKNQIERVAFAIPRADGKFVNTVAKVESTKEYLRLITTDGVRLALSTEPANYGEFSLIIPKILLELVGKLDGGDTVNITETDTAFYFVTSLETLTFCRTHGEFPNYHAVIPKAAFPTTITITNKEAFLTTLNAERPQADKEKPGVQITVVENGTSMSLAAVTEAPAGKEGSVFRNMADDELEVTVAGPGTSTKLDINLLKPYIERAPAPIALNIKGGIAVADFSSDNGKYRFLMMPMRQA